MITTLTLFKLINNICMCLTFLVDTVETVHYFQVTNIQLKIIKFNVLLIHFLINFCVYIYIFWGISFINLQLLFIGTLHRCRDFLHKLFVLYSKMFIILKDVYKKWKWKDFLIIISTTLTWSSKTVNFCYNGF